ncbi:MAG: helix-turn-helix transcriptional regulator [Methylobacterium frigidaeris]
MAASSLARTRAELSSFLTHHRRRLAPADVGLPTTGRRRTPGLRREEVAALAGVGLTWYTWFEQGRDIQVSQGFLLNVAKALRLDDAECGHLFLLAHRRPPPPEARHWPRVGAGIQRLLDDLVTRPALVLNLRWDVVAWNAAAERVFGFAGRSPPERNLIRLVFADPDLRRRLPEWPDDALRLLAQFRCDRATAPDDPAMTALIDELVALSPEFRRGFARAGPERYGRGLSSILDPDGARIDFTHETLIVDEHRHLRMVVYFPTTGD